nr:alanine aminotransferase 1-like [Chrysemys picta bellii]
MQGKGCLAIGALGCQSPSLRSTPCADCLWATPLQVAAICAYPELLHADSMPRDAKQRASRILQELHSSSAGAYNMEYVTTAVPQRVARYLERRDGGIRCDPRNIVMCGGITTAIVVSPA